MFQNCRKVLMHLSEVSSKYKKLFVAIDLQKNQYNIGRGQPKETKKVLRHMEKFEEKIGIHIGEKRPMSPQHSNAIEARSLMGTFRAKKDLYDYLQFHRQYYMLTKRKVTKDFLKEAFAVAQERIRPINVPKNDELSVQNLIKDVMSNQQLAKFFPEQRAMADLPEKQYFFNILNTVEPDYLSAHIKHSMGLDSTTRTRMRTRISLQSTISGSASSRFPLTFQGPWENLVAPQEGIQAIQVGLQAYVGPCPGKLLTDQEWGQSSGSWSTYLRFEP